MNPQFCLSSGRRIPLIGIGTYLIQGDQLIYDVLDNALSAGYRLIDTATVYHNEASIGKALKKLLPKYNLKREDVFITSKLSPNDQGDKAFQAVQTSLQRLDCEYIDLYLIHWPGSFGITSANDENGPLRDKSWMALVRAVKDGLVRDIGVSNYTVQHLKQLLSKNYGINPSVNQVEWHPKYHQPELLQLCRDNNILLQAYSSLGGSGNMNLLQDRTVNDIAKKLKKSSVQLLLRWALQQNISIIPKARTKEHIEHNMDLNFSIPPEDMQTLSNFNKVEKFSWDPTKVA